MNQPNLKPFNLDEALAGKPVVNGRGEPRFVTKLAKLLPSGEGLFVQDGRGVFASYYTLNGIHKLWDSQSLFMAPTLVTKWVNIYTSDTRFTLLHETEEHADRLATSNRLGNKAHPITYEE